ncbi:TonB-dependent receptor [Asticcacaulis excentricus]|uniref:TonB-dependent receptor n=1 Tax=Asticcacaulis excentricus TaxID=78587 RepID=UPI001E500786|nr:TonB-dependent receptor [Asticcacaulis excentricus]
MWLGFKKMHPFNTKKWMLAATGLAVVMYCTPALAQTTSEKAATPQAEDDKETVIIVKGLRKSLQSATEKKRKAKQIVESIEAEDVGKLPDNNVVEALAHVTGVQITRARGEGESLMIRGQSDVQTTLNGSPNNQGVGRAASLNDIPAELLKSVQVYKTRTADQVEGGIAGTVNVELRRPLDLKKGWTVAGSVRNVYSSIGSTESPYASALVAKRFDTPYGEMGFLLNLSYQENNYNEQYVQSETPMDFRWWTSMLKPENLGAAVVAANPAGEPGTLVSIYRAQYGVEAGKVRRPSVNFSYQWRVNENLDFVLEASSFKSRGSNMYSALNTRIKDNPTGVISNLTFQPDGKTIRSMRLTDTLTGAGDGLNVGPTSRFDSNVADNQRINFETHWHNERARIDFVVYKDENSFNNQWITQSQRFKNLKYLTIDMASDKVPGTGPWVEYFDVNGQKINTADINNYQMFELEDGKGFEKSSEFVWQADFTYRLSDDKFFREFKAGVRKSDRDVERAYGYRFARFGYDYGTRVDKHVSLLSFPGGSAYEAVTADIDGFASPTWYRISRKGLVDNYAAIRAYAADVSKRSAFGGSGDWNDEIVSTEQLSSSFNSNEKTAAIYAQLAYGFNAWGAPIDGLIGVRSVTYAGEGSAVRYVNGEPQPYTFPNKGGTDVMPNANAVIHFTPKLQLRLAYTVNIQRPNFQDTSPFVMYDTGSCKCGWGGNPELNVNKETSYDASLEYYFGRGGLLSAATYVKKPDNFTVWRNRSPRYIDDAQFPGIYYIDSPDNGGPGEYRGIELTARSFFDFLPKPWSDFGAEANMTYNQKAEIRYRYYNGEEITPTDLATIPGLYDAPNNSKYTYNLTAYYETPKLSARVTYNHRDRYRGYLDGYALKGYSQYIEPTERLDAALNWTPVKFMTLSLEGTNLTEDKTQVFYGADKLLPQGVRVPARTVQLSARFRY